MIGTLGVKEAFMSGHVHITGRVIAAARALVGVSAADFASAAGFSTDTLGRIE